MNAADLFDRITNAAHQVRPRFAALISEAWDAGNTTGTAFEPDDDIVEDATRRGACGTDLDLYVADERIIAVACVGGDLAVDVTEDVQAGLEAGL